MIALARDSHVLYLEGKAGVGEGVMIGVGTGVGVDVGLGVDVGVAVGADVGVSVGVSAGMGVGAEGAAASSWVGVMGAIGPSVRTWVALSSGLGVRDATAEATSVALGSASNVSLMSATIVALMSGVGDDAAAIRRSAVVPVGTVGAGGTVDEPPCPQATVKASSSRFPNMIRASINYFYRCQGGRKVGPLWRWSADPSSPSSSTEPPSPTSTPPPGWRRLTTPPNIRLWPRPLGAGATLPRH